jgi:predicted Zn-dependent peptidase
MYCKTVLDNGLRIITSTMPHTRAVCLGIFIGAGSRYESADEAGTSHFVEHLCFKGTERRATAKEVCEPIEGVGGILNGGTDKELTVYWSKVARPHFSLALDVLSDMLLHSKFDPSEVEKERQVIIEEINMSLDSPSHRVDMLIDEVLWPDQALGRDVAGTKETVAALSQHRLLDYGALQYLPNNTVVSVAGDIGHDEVVSSLSQAFSDWHDGAPRPWYPAEDEQNAPRCQVEHRDTEQAHLCLALRGLPLLHPDRFTLDLLNVILGEGMSSRLFLEVREKRGLAYDIHSYVSHFLDSGSINICAGVAPRHLNTAIEAVLEEVARLKEGIPEPELVKAKELSKGRLLLRMEDTRSVAGWLGVQEALTGRILTVDEAISMIDGVSADGLARVAQMLLVADKLNVAVVSPHPDGEQLRALLRL